MKILGIESSCDETAAVVADGREILSSVVALQIDIHRKYGGVMPELASREHLRQIVPVVREALAQAGIMLADVDAMGVTQARDLSARCWACALVQEKQTNWKATADRKTFLAGRLQ